MTDAKGEGLSKRIELEVALVIKQKSLVGLRHYLVDPSGDQEYKTTCQKDPAVTREVFIGLEDKIGVGIVRNIIQERFCVVVRPSQSPSSLVAHVGKCRNLPQAKAIRAIGDVVGFCDALDAL